MSQKIIQLILLAGLFCNIYGYKPVAIVHGIMFDPKDHMEFLKKEIQKAEPNTEVNIIDILWDQGSFLPMWYQVSQFGAEIKKMIEKYPDGINIIAYSQGGLIARGVVETTPDHNVETFISLSSPQFGFHGEYYVPHSQFYVGKEEHFSDSVAGFWKDPKDLGKYKKDQRYSAALDNEFKHELSDQFKESMCKLKKLVLIGGPDDGIVVPWESSQFAYDNENGKIVTLKDQEIYKSDRICLKTLDERGAIVIHTVPGVKHPDWFNNATVIKDTILPYLA